MRWWGRYARSRCIGQLMEDSTRWRPELNQSTISGEPGSYCKTLHNHRLQINFDFAFLLSQQSSGNLSVADSDVYIGTFIILYMYIKCHGTGPTTISIDSESYWRGGGVPCLRPVPLSTVPVTWLPVAGQRPRITFTCYSELFVNI